MLCHGQWHFMADGVHFVRSYLSWPARINILKQNISKKLRFTFTLGIPYCLTVEPASVCNLRCSTCPAGLKQQMCSPALLQLEDFKKAIDMLGDYLTYIQLWSWGEPFLNPLLPEMITYAKKKHIIVVCSTNGHYLQDDEYINRLVHSGLDELILAVDGTSQDVYEKYRQGGDLDMVLSGIKKLVNIRRHEKKTSPRLHMRMVVNPFNENQIEAFYDLAQNLGVDIVSLKKIDTGMGGIAGNAELLPQNQDYVIQFADSVYPYKCPNFWNFPVLSSNGRIGMCSLDANRVTELLHISEMKPVKKH